MAVAGFDLEALVAPLAGDHPTGQDPREDFSATSLYYRLRDARADARAAERQADADGGAEAPPVPQWAAVQRMAADLLMTQAKDLEVAAWLTEALLRSHELAGLAAGARLMATLVDMHWDALHPLPDDEGIARRIAPVAGLNGEAEDGTLIQPMRKLPLFTAPGGAPFAVWQYQQSAELAGIGDAAQRQRRLASGVVPFEEVEKAARGASARFGLLRVAAIEAQAAWNALTAALETRAGADAPPTTRVRDLLAEILNIIERYAPATPDAAAQPDASVQHDTAVPAPGPFLHGAIVTRDDALRALEDIADYFLRSEPHSPLSYTLREAVRRARLPWPELLQEVVPDRDSRAAILNALGIRPEPEPE